MRRLALLPCHLLVLGTAIVVGSPACNAILDNEPGALGRAPAPDASSGDDAAARDRGPASQEDGGATSSLDGPAFEADAEGPSCTGCDLPHATAACVDGACVIGACAAGFADCNADPTDGCETDLGTVMDCGGCGIVCPAAPHVTVACVAGTCTAECAPGFGDCNAKPKDGCERDLTSDRHDCGACGVRCVIGRCELGRCVWP